MRAEFQGDGGHAPLVLLAYEWIYRERRMADGDLGGAAELAVAVWRLFPFRFPGGNPEYRPAFSLARVARSRRAPSAISSNPGISSPALDTRGLGGVHGARMGPPRPVLRFCWGSSS